MSLLYFLIPKHFNFHVNVNINNPKNNMELRVYSNILQMDLFFFKFGFALLHNLYCLTLLSKIIGYSDQSR